MLARKVSLWPTGWVTQPELAVVTTGLDAASGIGPRTGEAIGRPPDRRTATVLSFTDNVLTVELRGGAVEEVGWVDSYEPNVGDVVFLVAQRSSWLCIGVAGQNGGGGIPVGGLAGGVIFNAFVAGVNVSTVETQVPDFLFTANLKANRLYSIRAQFRTKANATTTEFPFVRIRRDSLAGPVYYEEYAKGSTPSTSRHTINIYETWIRLPADTTATFLLTAFVTSGATWNVTHGGGDCFVALDHGFATNVTSV